MYIGDTPARFDWEYWVIMILVSVLKVNSIQKAHTSFSGQLTQFFRTRFRRYVRYIALRKSYSRKNVNMCSVTYDICKVLLHSFAKGYT